MALTYDADGNTQTQTDASGARTFRYDARDRLMTLEQPNAPPLNFDYQSDGLRLAKTQSGQETRYQYDQQSLLAETNAIGNPLSRYHYSATQLISRTEAGSTPTQRHYLSDALGTPIALLTQQGSVSARTRYDAWGEIVTQQDAAGVITTSNTDGPTADLTRTDQQPIGYTGYLTDSESGLYYAKARYYDPRIARFTTVDPEEGKAMQPPSLHRYLYAYANPTVYTDPSGRCPPEWTSCNLRMSAAFNASEHEQQTLQYVAALNDHEDAKRGARLEGTLATTVEGFAGVGQLVSDYTTGGLTTDIALHALGLPSNGALDRQAALRAAILHPRDTFYNSIDQPLQAATAAQRSGDDIEQAYQEGVAAGNFLNTAAGAEGLARGFVTNVGRPGSRLPWVRQPKVGAADTGVVAEHPAISVEAALPDKTVYVDPRGNALVASVDLPTNYRGERVVMPDGHQLNARDRGLDAPPIYRDGPFTGTDREAFLSGTAGATKLAPHHRHLLPTSSGGVIDELRGPGHPQGNDHTSGMPNRHPNASIFRRMDGGESLRGREIREHWMQKGGRLIEIEPGVWIDPGPGG